MTTNLINYACAKMSPQNPKRRVQRTSGLVNEWGFGERGMTEDGMKALCFLPTPFPMHLLHLALPELYPLLTAVPTLFGTQGPVLWRMGVG